MTGFSETAQCRFACAKINLYLKVTARRADGYHELQSLFLPLQFPADTVRLSGHPERGIHVCCPGITGENIASRAAVAFAAAAQISDPAWQIEITKAIPSAAGMGGGSSDAASVLLLLQDTLPEAQRLPEETLQKIARSLGADVPFFLHPTPAIMSGIGEKRQALDFAVPAIPLVLVNPGFPISARSAYQMLTPEQIGDSTESRQKLAALLTALHTQDWVTVGQNMQNDLEPGVLKKFPLLTMIEEELSDLGACRAMMTGSGSTIFAVCASSAEAEKLCNVYSERHPEFWVKSTTTATSSN